MVWGGGGGGGGCWKTEVPGSMLGGYLHIFLFI